MIKINKQYVLEKLNKLLTTDSPSGYTFKAMELIKNWAKELNYKFESTNKGGGIITIPGKYKSKTIGLSAHVDTLGCMVKSISDSGTLLFTLVGSPIVPTLDCEYCKIYTRENKVYSGTFLSTSPAIHVFDDARTKERIPKNMEIRLDENVTSKEDVKKLGIEVGDFICIDTKTTIINDFIKSRFIDDKASVICIFGVMEYLSKNLEKPNYTTKIIISNYEEVGHGASYIPNDISEILAVDMGCIGDDLNCTEYDVSICAKDSSGPYDYHIISKLINIAKENNLKYVVDVYPYYNSDLSAALRGGNNIKGALIGPGTSASHGLERTHYSALENTMYLVYKYLTTD